MVPETPKEFRDRLQYDPNSGVVIAIVGILVNRDESQPERSHAKLDPARPLVWYAKAFVARLKSPSEVPLVYYKPKAPEPGKPLADPVGFEGVRLYPNVKDGPPYGIGTMPRGFRGPNHWSPTTGKQPHEVSRAYVSVINREGKLMTIFTPTACVMPVSLEALRISVSRNRLASEGRIGIRALPDGLRQTFREWRDEIQPCGKNINDRFLVSGYNLLRA